ncbi:acyltransferase [Acinetobacter pittii]|uniref:acyltransferase n=1 Tax=Acinetobacter pittii TaxID=48296 RepID=UPI00208F54FA|nr:acyltransferase [Acinetobacter pittii]
MRVLKKFFSFFYSRYLLKLAPEKYLHLIGVNVKGKVHIYGGQPGMFGSEPWLITLGNNVHITAGCRFINHDGGVLILRHLEPSLEITKPINIGDNVYLGTNTIILPGVNIGNNVIVGAGSLVNKDLADNAVYAGIPAKFIKTLDDYYAKCLKDSLKLGHLSAEEKDKELKKIYKSN